MVDGSARRKVEREENEREGARLDSWEEAVMGGGGGGEAGRGSDCFGGVRGEMSVYWQWAADVR